MSFWRAVSSSLSAVIEIVGISLQHRFLLYCHYTIANKLVSRLKQFQVIDFRRQKQPTWHSMDSLYDSEEGGCGKVQCVAMIFFLSF